MRSALRFGLIAAVGALGSLSVALDARALQLNHAGSICQPYFASQAGDFQRSPYGFKNISTGSRYVICPLVHSPFTSDYSAAAYIDGKNSDTQKTTCTLYSVAWNQQLNGTKSITGGGTAGAAWFQFASLNANQSPTYSSLSVLCNVPPNAWITDIEVTK